MPQRLSEESAKAAAEYTGSWLVRELGLDLLDARAELKKLKDALLGASRAASSEERFGELVTEHVMPLLEVTEPETLRDDLLDARAEIAAKDAEIGRLRAEVERQREVWQDVEAQLDKLADLLADSEEIPVGQTTAVATLNRVLDILPGVEKQP